MIHRLASVLVYLQIIRLLPIMLGVGAFPAAVDAANVTAEETKLRAAIVLGILRFTSWPHDVHMASAFSLCTHGLPLSQPALKQISGLRQINNIPVKVSEIQDVHKGAAGCNALVIGEKAEAEHITKAIKERKLYGVLTICDACQANSVRSMVHLIRNENRIGFEIDLSEAKKGGMFFSSALLELAVEVHQE